LAILITIEIVSGLILFLPEIGIDMEWVYETLVARRTLKWLHEIISYPLIGVVGIHLALNWKIIKRYPKTMFKQPLRKVTSLILITLGTIGAVTGLLLKYYFIYGGGGSGKGRRILTETVIPTLFGLVREDFVWIHSYITLAVIALLLIHVLVNKRLIGYYLWGPKKKKTKAKKIKN